MKITLQHSGQVSSHEQCDVMTQSLQVSHHRTVLTTIVQQQHLSTNTTFTSIHTKPPTLPDYILRWLI